MANDPVRPAQRYFDALKEIASYQSPAALRRSSEKQYGLSAEEALEMAYENIIQAAKLAIRGKRRPEALLPKKEA